MLQNERLCHNMIHEHLHTFDMNRNGNHFQCLKPPLVPKKETAHNCRQNPFQNISPRRWCQFSLALALRADRALEIHWRSAPPLAERSRTANRNRALNLSPVSWTASSSVDGILSPDVAPLDFISSRWSGSNSSNKAFSSSPPAMSSRCMPLPCSTCRSSSKFLSTNKVSLWMHEMSFMQSLPSHSWSSFASNASGSSSSSWTSSSKISNKPGSSLQIFR